MTVGWRGSLSAEEQGEEGGYGDDRAEAPADLAFGGALPTELVEWEVTRTRRNCDDDDDENTSRRRQSRENDQKWSRTYLKKCKKGKISKKKKEEEEDRTIGPIPSALRLRLRHPYGPLYTLQLLAWLGG